jgi:hypothetical protein
MYRTRGIPDCRVIETTGEQAFKFAASHHSDTCRGGEQHDLLVRIVKSPAGEKAPL